MPATARQNGKTPHTPTPESRIAPEALQSVPETVSGAYWQALRMAAAIVEGFRVIHGREPTEAERVIATTLFIEASRSGRPLSK